MAGYIFRRVPEKSSHILTRQLFFKCAADKTKRNVLAKIIEKEEGVRVATKILELVSKDDEARAIYEAQLIFEFDQRSEVINAERRGEARGEVRGEAWTFQT